MWVINMGYMKHCVIAHIIICICTCTCTCMYMYLKRSGSKEPHTPVHVHVVSSYIVDELPHKTFQLRLHPPKTAPHSLLRNFNPSFNLQVQHCKKIKKL